MTQITIPAFTFLNILLFIGALGLAVQAFIGLAFFISCIWEKEPRATVFSALQFLGMMAMLIIYFILIGSGFFKTGAGIALLIAFYVIGIMATVLLLRKTDTNPRALEGTPGLIVGEVNRFDERDQVFARNRALRPGSAEYKAYYEAHPEKESIDAERRAKGGPMGPPGIIDNPHEGPNVAATLASLNIPRWMFLPKKRQRE
jgi:hypothetical protein